MMGKQARLPETISEPGQEPNAILIVIALRASGAMNKTILVNRDNPVPSDYRASIEIVSIQVEENFCIELEKETAENYLQLKSHLASFGIRVEALSGFRFQKTQQRIWDESVAAHGEAHTERYVAKPGYSEHQTGLALDLTLYDDKNDLVEDDDIEAYAELFPHLHEFGFILRYPAEKEHVTGYPFEPWHIRYVGVEAASQIYENGWTLEEYVAHAEGAPEGVK